MSAAFFSRMAFVCGAIALSAIAVLDACSVKNLGELPARCGVGGSGSSSADVACPKGYECINEVCAKPGTLIPNTLTTLQYLRSTDLRLVPESDSALVVWQIYRYDIELHDFAGARIFSDGHKSPNMNLVTQYPANANYLEPYFDVISTSDTELLMSMGAAPADDKPAPRLTQFAVHLPPVGSEATGATFDKLWELRMRTIGYGAVSQPRFARTQDGIALSYFESLITAQDTIGDIASFRIADDGSRKDPPACTDSSCCQANDCFTTRAGYPVAVSVFDAFDRDPDVWWIIDDTRPSFVRQSAGEPAVFADGSLPRLAVPVDASKDTITFLSPSARAAQGLPSDPVQGPASLWTASLDGSATPKLGTAVKIGDLPGVRDTPAPVWISRDGKPALLITPGTDIGAPEIAIYTVDPKTATATLATSIKRYSSIPIAVIRATIINGKLYVAWLDTSPDVATVRAEVLAEP